MATLSRLLRDGELSLLLLACFNRSPKLVGGCNWIAE